MDLYVANDPELSFVEAMQQEKGQNTNPSGTESLKVPKSETITPKTESEVKYERPEDILRSDKNEIIVKLEKGEGTLKIEKIAMKKEPSEKVFIQFLFILKFFPN